MAIGSFVLFDRFLNVNLVDGDANILTDDIYAVICGSSQVLSASFVGSSGDCRYSDLTDELSTGDGYTTGGLILPDKTVTVSGGWSALKASPLTWTMTDLVTGVKYVVLFNATSTNSDLIGFYDLDDTGGTITINTGDLIMTPHSDGIFRWKQQ